MPATQTVPTRSDPGRYALYVSTSGGLFRSVDQGQSWSRWGRETLIVERLLGTPNGDLFAIGTQAEGADRASGLFLLPADETAWRATRFTDRPDPQWGFRLRAVCFALLFPSHDNILVGTGAGLWLYNSAGTEHEPLGPSGIRPDRPAAVLDVVVSRSHYGEVDPVMHPLILAACDSGMHWTRWGEPWFRPYPPPNDSLTRLTEYADSVAAWTSRGVYLNRDARAGDWEHIDPAKADRMRELVYSVKEDRRDPARSEKLPRNFVAVRVAPDNETVWCSNGPQLWMAQADFGSTHYPHSWQCVWEDDRDSSFAPGRGRRPFAMPPVFSPEYEQDHTAFAVTSCGGVIKTTDSGVTWAPANDGLDSPTGLELIAVASA